MPDERKDGSDFHQPLPLPIQPQLPTYQPPFVIQQQQPGGGIVGAVTEGVKTFAGLRPDQITLFLVVLVTLAVVGAGVYGVLFLAPKLLMDDRNNWIRTTQEERERDRGDRERDRQLNDQNNVRWMDLVKSEGEKNRKSSESQTKQLYDGTLTISKELGKVQSSNERLEQSIQKLESTIRNKMPPADGDCHPEDRPWWNRLVNPTCDLAITAARLGWFARCNRRREFDGKPSRSVGTRRARLPTRGQ